MTKTIDIDYWIGDLRKLDKFRDELPEYMNECPDEVRTHRVEGVRWVSERRDVGNLSYVYEGLVADVQSTEEDGGNACCGGASIGFTLEGVVYVKEISYGH